MTRFFDTALAAALMAPFVASASNWAPVTADAKSNYFVDVSSVANVGPYKKAWVRLDYNEVQTVVLQPDKKYVTDKALWYFDCPGKRISLVSSTSYDALGQVQSSFTGRFDARQLSDVIPDTVGEAMLESVCNMRFTLLPTKKK